MNRTKPPYILVADDDPATRELLASFPNLEGFQIVGIRRGIEAFTMAVSRVPALILVDAHLPRIDGYSLCRRLRETTPTRAVPILMLASDDQPENRLAALEAGADNYVVKPADPEELVLAIQKFLWHPLAPASPHTPSRPHGRVITFLGARKGVGKTTLSVNTAVALSLHSARRVLLLDTAFPGGDVQAHLKLPPARALPDLSRRLSRLDPDRLAQFLVRHRSGLSVLSCPFPREQAGPIAVASFYRVLAGAAAQFDYIVVNGPSGFEERTLGILDMSDNIVLVITPQIDAYKSLRPYFDLLVRLGVPADKFHLMLNRADSTDSTKRQKIEAALDRRIDFEIRDGGGGLRHNLRDLPLVHYDPNHPLSRQILQVADVFQNLPPPLSSHKPAMADYRKT